MTMKKNWKTTTLGIISALLVLGGQIYPEQLNTETQEEIMFGMEQLLTGGGALVAIITGWWAKDK